MSKKLFTGLLCGFCTVLLERANKPSITSIKKIANSVWLKVL